jgi:lactoylglutathione lyase
MLIVTPSKSWSCHRSHAIEVLPPKGGETDIACCAASLKSRAGITPHGSKHDCRLRGSAAFSSMDEAGDGSTQTRQYWDLTAALVSRGDSNAQKRSLKLSHRDRLRPGMASGDAQQANGEIEMPIVTWDHVHLRSPDPEATAAWLENILGGVIIRGPGRIDVKLGGANVFIAPVAAGDGVNTPPVTPYQGLDHFGLTVKDIDAVAAEIKAKGVEFTKEPTTIRPGVRICFLRGPQGISIELLERDKKYA